MGESSRYALSQFHVHMRIVYKCKLLYRVSEVRELLLSRGANSFLCLCVCMCAHFSGYDVREVCGYIIIRLLHVLWLPSLHATSAICPFDVTVLSRNERVSVYAEFDCCGEREA